MNIAIKASGMVTAVGLDSPSSCASLRARIDGFAETGFISKSGDWIKGAGVPLSLPPNLSSSSRMANLAAGAIKEILEICPELPVEGAIILCTAEKERPGSPINNPVEFMKQMSEILGVETVFRTQLLSHGRPSGFAALQQADKLLEDDTVSMVLILGVDSLLTKGAIDGFIDRIAAPEQPNGFIPGEAAGAILVSRSEGRLRVAGLGLSRERAFIYNGLDDDGSDLPLRGDGMVAAYQQAFSKSGISHAEVALKLGDLIGESFWFKQMSLAMTRTQRGSSPVQPIWPIAASLGNVGAAVVPIMIGWALAATEKNYAPPGPILIEASGDDGACGAAVLVRS